MNKELFVFTIGKLCARATWATDGINYITDCHGDRITEIVSLSTVKRIGENTVLRFTIGPFCIMFGTV